MNLDGYLPLATVVFGGSLAGMCTAALGLAVIRVRDAEYEALRAATAAELAEIPTVVTDPLVEAITGDIEIIRVCPHLSRLDRLGGLTCSCTDSRTAPDEWPSTAIAPGNAPGLTPEER